ncbi:hypothetical protein [Photobacterium damselae]|uniref:hypothetical protein n=1 Tax=Photobacterium damselae TaxID=38293 RepID=UPI0040691174
MKEIRISVPTDLIKSLSKSLDATKFRKGRTLKGELTSKESVVKLGNNSWYPFKNLSIDMDGIEQNVYMKTGDFYQNLNDGGLVRLKGTRNKFLRKTENGFQNFDLRVLSDSDRLVLSATQGFLNEALSDHNNKLSNPRADFKSVVAAAYKILSSFPFHSRDSFVDADNTATSVSCVARDVAGRNIGFKSSYWAGEAKKTSPSQTEGDYQAGFNTVMSSKTLDESFKNEFIGYMERKYLNLSQIDSLCEVMESAIMDSGLKLGNQFDNKLVGVIGELSNDVIGKCLGYCTERKVNGSAEYVILVKTEDDSCVKLRSGAPYPKKFVIDAFNNSKDMVFSGVILSQTPAITYDHLTPLLQEKLRRPAITEMAVSPNSLKFKEDLVVSCENNIKRTVGIKMR